eukprot:348037-Pleurochrysis_carterae.AAC.1
MAEGGDGGNEWGRRKRAGQGTDLGLQNCKKRRMERSADDAVEAKSPISPAPPCTCDGTWSCGGASRWSRPTRARVRRSPR